MTPYRVIREDADRFVVHDGEKEFGLPKGRLRHSTVERIRKFAKGGKVEADDAAPVTEDENQTWRDRAIAGADNETDPTWATIQKYALPGSPAAPPEPALETGPIQAATAAANATPQPPAQPQAPAPKAPAEPDAAGQIRTSTEDAAEALRRKADLEQFSLAGIAKTQQAQAQHLQEVQAATQKMLQDRMAHSDALFNDIASDKIDPNHFYATRSVGQKIAGAIGLILGGIGSGLTGQPNAALGIIQKQIDRDIEAQRLNLGKKENLLSHYMRQTGDLVAAQHMAQADYLTAAAAQLAAEHARAGSMLAAPEAQAAIAQLRAGAVQATQAAVQRSLQIKETQINLALSQQHAQALGQMLKGLSGGGGFDRRILEMPGFEKYRERAVDLPDGTLAFAADKEEANKATESYQHLSAFGAKLKRYSDLLRSGNPATLERGKAQEMRADLLAEMGHLHDLNRLTDVDLQLFEKQVPDLTDFIKPMAGQKLKGLEKSVNDKVWSRNKALLHLPDSARPKVSE